MVAPTSYRTDRPAVPTRTLLRVIVALRIFVGVDWLSNALAKLINVDTFHWGFTTFNLVDRNTAMAIARQAATSTSIAPLRAFYTNVVLPNWGFFQWFLTAAEFAVGLGLLLGIATRLAAIGGLLLIAPIWIMLATTNQYLWTYPLDIFPLVLLAIVPAGRLAGFDGRLAARLGARWPF
ncbi:MAG TPA: DoxX family membrane protein [Pseudonocardiaceae bacterium]|jgi:uncharacterized membrane protein YphA (DoxX/SURF4 family)|nr:DoxX family membrane protein [Pseudonocardiaceae bacterium]